MNIGCINIIARAPERISVYLYIDVYYDIVPKS